LQIGEPFKSDRYLRQPVSTQIEISQVSELGQLRRYPGQLVINEIQEYPLTFRCQLHSLYQSENLSPEQSALLHEQYEHIVAIMHKLPQFQQQVIHLRIVYGLRCTEIATIITPGTYARSDSFFYVNNHYMLMGLDGNFDIWDITTGRLLYKYHGSTPFSIPSVNGSIVLWSPDGKYLTMLAETSSGNGQVAIWHLP
jgi:hypothetical protein